MLESFFYLILNMSLAASVVIIALLLIRQIKSLPKRIVYPLWSLAFFRLVLPFTFSTKWSLFNFTGGLVKRLVSVETITQRMPLAPRAETWTVMNMLGAADSYIPIEYKTESLMLLFSASSAIWAIVTAALLMTFAILYILTLAELRKAVHVRDNLYCSEILLSPVLIGIIHPKIIFPPGLDPDGKDGKMVLAHENIHLKRLDNLWRALTIGVACIHWFNPLVWVTLKAFITDMELSCDEVVVSNGCYSAEERRAYAYTLVRLAEGKRLLIPAAFGRSGVKVRVVNVLNYRRLTVIGAIASSAFLLVTALVLLTNPMLRG